MTRDCIPLPQVMEHWNTQKTYVHWKVIACKHKGEIPDEVKSMAAPSVVSFPRFMLPFYYLNENQKSTNNSEILSEGLILASFAVKVHSVEPMMKPKQSNVPERSRACSPISIS